MFETFGLYYEGVFKEYLFNGKGKEEGQEIEIFCFIPLFFLLFSKKANSSSVMRIDMKESSKMAASVDMVG